MTVEQADVIAQIIDRGVFQHFHRLPTRERFDEAVRLITPTVSAHLTVFPLVARVSKGTGGFDQNGA